MWNAPCEAAASHPELVRARVGVRARVRVRVRVRVTASSVELLLPSAASASVPG